MEFRERLKYWNSALGSLRDPGSPESIKELLVYDFDNTLYRSPAPNPELYTKASIGRLSDITTFPISGGWWRTTEMLAQSQLNSEGVPLEEYWNLEMIKSAKNAMTHSSCLSILLTGRDEAKFAPLIESMVSDVPGLEFHALCLRKMDLAETTAQFKMLLLRDLVRLLPKLEKVTIYDDRVGQVKHFQEAGSGFADLKWDVQLVPAQITWLPHDTERRCVRAMVRRERGRVKIFDAPAIHAYVPVSGDGTRSQGWIIPTNRGGPITARFRVIAAAQGDANCLRVKCESDCSVGSQIMIREPRWDYSRDFHTTHRNWLRKYHTQEALLKDHQAWHALDQPEELSCELRLIQRSKIVRLRRR